MSEEAPAGAGPSPGPAGQPQVAAGAPGPPRMEVPPLVAGNAPFLLTLAVVGAGFAYTAVVPEHWLRGVLVAAGGFLLGAALRLLLPEQRAGMLAIRGRALDAACFGGVAVLIVTVGVLLPR